MNSYRNYPKDWQHVVEMDLKGWVRINPNGDCLIIGQLDQIIITVSQEVQVYLRQVMYQTLDLRGNPTGKATSTGDSSRLVLFFQNNTVPFQVQNVSTEEECIQFRYGRIYKNIGQGMFAQQCE
jgi:hypothetical protein